jgi:hypothetical protein
MSGNPTYQELGVRNPTGLLAQLEFLVRVVQRRFHVQMVVDFGVFSARGKSGVRQEHFAFEDADFESLRFDHDDLAVPIARHRARLV